MGGIVMINKMERFVSSLTDQEIDCQLKDIFEWARVYKELLETEQAYRRKNKEYNLAASTDLYGEDDGDSYDVEPIENVEKELGIDYELAQMIQQKVSSFSAEKTREQLEKLKQISTHSLCPADLAQLQYEIETCELHLFELTGEALGGGLICPSCGSELEANARFCGKCGASIKGG